jgi:hypothetical protein
MVCCIGLVDNRITIKFIYNLLSADLFCTRMTHFKSRADAETFWRIHKWDKTLERDFKCSLNSTIKIDPIKASNKHLSKSPQPIFHPKGHKIITPINQKIAHIRPNYTSTAISNTVMYKKAIKYPISHFPFWFKNYATW